MKIERNGQQFELSFSELMAAHEEYKLDCTIADINEIYQQVPDLDFELSDKQVKSIAENAIHNLSQNASYFEAYWESLKFTFEEDVKKILHERETSLEEEKEEKSSHSVSKTYWGNNGKYQGLADNLADRAPGYGYTSNAYVNVYLVMAHLYYDAYNNGGGNIEDSYSKDFYNRVVPYLGDKVDIEAFIKEDFVKMEVMMDAALEFLRDKNLDFPVYSFWCNHDAYLVSACEPVGERTSSDYWFKMTFGEPEEMKKYLKLYCHLYKDITNEFVKAPEQVGQGKMSLDAIIKDCAAQVRKEPNPDDIDRSRE